MVSRVNRTVKNMMRRQANNPPSATRHPKSARRRASGFTLIEASLTTVIIGTGVLAILSAQQAYHMKNNWATRTSTGMLLANEMRERTLSLPPHDPITGDATLGPEADEAGPLAYDDLDDFAGQVTNGVGSGSAFNPPINALGLPLPELSQWKQTINVQKVPADHVDTTFTLPLDTGSSDMFRVTVVVLYTDPGTGNEEPVTELSWIVTGTP